MKLKLTALLLSSSLLFGQEEAQPNNVEELEPIVVESSPLAPSVSDTTQAWSVLSGDDLKKSKGATIAETLSETPGVSQTGFGPSANRPIIRGLDKFRVRVLQNGTDTFDVSAQSEDHAVPIDPLMVDRIEVLPAPDLPISSTFCNMAPLGQRAASAVASQVCGSISQSRNPKEYLLAHG